MEVSVILPTHNRATMMEGALVSLCEQSYDHNLYEIILVNNNSQDNTDEVSHTVAARYPSVNIRQIFEPIEGLSRARNTGIDASTAPFVAFTEDDAIMPPDWLAKLVEPFRSHGTELAKVGGEIEPIWESPPPVWISEAMMLLLSATSGMKGRTGFCDPPLLESNSCYRKQALQDIGGFPVAMGRQGNSLLSGEQVVDIHIHIRGGKIYHEPSVVMYHKISSARVTPKWLRRRSFWQGASYFLAEKYLENLGYSLGRQFDLHLPLDPAEWQHINNPDLPPDDEHLQRLRNLGFALAASGMIVN